MKILKWFMIPFLVMFIYCWTIPAVYALTDALEIDGQILYKDNVDYVSKIQQTPEYSLSTLKNDPCWYFFIYFKNPQKRHAAIISAKDKQQIKAYYTTVIKWVEEK